MAEVVSTLNGLRTKNPNWRPRLKIPPMIGIPLDHHNPWACVIRLASPTKRKGVSEEAGHFSSTRSQ